MLNTVQLVELGSMYYITFVKEKTCKTWFELDSLKETNYLIMFKSLVFQGYIFTNHEAKIYSVRMEKSYKYQKIMRENGTGAFNYMSALLTRFCNGTQTRKHVSQSFLESIRNQWVSVASTQGYDVSSYCATYQPMEFFDEGARKCEAHSIKFLI